MSELSSILDAIAGRGRVTAEDVLAIRTVIYRDGGITAAEAEGLFGLEDRVEEHDPAWAALFVEALSIYLVDQVAPPGYVSRENVDWLLARISKDGHVRTETELALLVNVLGKAISTPDPLAVYALNEVKAQVLRSNRLGDREVDLLRKVLYAAGGEQGIAISRAEADVIYDIQDARAGSEDDPAWTDLFAKVMLSHLMFASGYAPPPREEVLRREAWLDDTKADVGGFMKKMAASLGSVLKTYRQPDFEEEWLRNRTAIQQEAEQVTDEEARWVAGRMLRDGKLSAAEQALVAALRAEHPQLHPAIQAAIDKLA